MFLSPYYEGKKPDFRGREFQSLLLGTALLYGQLILLRYDRRQLILQISETYRKKIAILFVCNRIASMITIKW